jgi:hypothetical protein
VQEFSPLRVAYKFSTTPIIQRVDFGPAKIGHTGWTSGPPAVKKALL